MMGASFADDTGEDARVYTTTAELGSAGQPLRLRSGQAQGGCPHVVFAGEGARATRA